jgi:hypothetical protein
MSKKLFKKRMKQYEEIEPFTKTQTKRYSFQELNFIRAIQVTRRTSLKETIKTYNETKRKDKESMRDLSSEVSIASELKTPRFGIKQKRKIKKPKTKKDKKDKKDEKSDKKRVYEFKGKTKNAPQKIKDRFITQKGTTRNYYDSKTGEIISRRERDRRISTLIN